MQTIRCQPWRKLTARLNLTNSGELRELGCWPGQKFAKTWAFWGLQQPSTLECLGWMSCGFGRVCVSWGVGSGCFGLLAQPPPREGGQLRRKFSLFTDLGIEDHYCGVQTAAARFQNLRGAATRRDHDYFCTFHWLQKNEEHFGSKECQDCPKMKVPIPGKPRGLAMPWIMAKWNEKKNTLLLFCTGRDIWIDGIYFLHFFDKATSTKNDNKPGKG